ncbi:MAG: hydrolase 1, exosortase A system-associated [Burkholderiales bacterium]|uniref:hydrolase 1, exosortase A system-associated n=1 Tax=Nitrosomonas sp. TaxID=42353 RepID=UPI001DB2FA08|nr:hydrolase 1, exosortase A system-associated [Nitrosomonas sp.]MCB1947557.1 hydrolase 1, exosortase A system-associated [Nitrosomonas sp.]MCP5244198.1 hydrolase 1, exosortase A system-associated [Burkholderiales bacterium]
MLPSSTEIPVVFPCETDLLVGIISKPDKASRIGVVIVVAGGPQYRVGAHRQFVTLARLLASHAIASIRFDHRGTGDSTGELRGFVDMNADIQSAVNVLLESVPEIDKIVLWGECESATASAFYSYTDPRIQGIFMVNPWIRTDAGLAKTMIRYYYWHRLLEKSFWTKVMSGQFSITASLKSCMTLIKSTLSNKRGEADSSVDEAIDILPLPERLAESCRRFSGEMFILTSGRDYIAREFNDYVETSKIWQELIASGRVTLKAIPEADHTFSRLEWRNKLLEYTVSWLKNIESVQKDSAQ